MNNTSNISGNSRSSASSSSSSSSSSSIHQYAALIQTVTELRTDLEKAVSKIHHLEKENARSQSNYSKLKEELVDTRRKYSEARENYHVAATEKLAAEKMYEEFMERVKIQLTEKTKEFELLRDKFAPQDIDYIRIKLQEELEIPHRHKIQQMENEAEAMREQYYAVRRELERCRAEFDAFSNNQRNDFVAAQEESEGIIVMMRMELEKYRGLENSSEKDDIIRTQRLKLQELSQFSDSLKEEVKNHNKERDLARLQIAEYQSRSEELVARLRANVSIAESDKICAEQRQVTLTQEIDRKDAAVTLLRHKVDELTSQFEELRFKATATESKLNESKIEQSELQISMKAQHNAEIHEFQIEIDHLNGKLNEREESLRRSQRDANDMQVKAELMHSEVSRSYQHKIQEFQVKQEVMKKDMMELTDNFNKKEALLRSVQDKLLVEIETLKIELIPLRREKEILHLRMIEMEKTLDNERKQHAAIRREHSISSHTLQQSLAAETARIKEYEMQLNSSKLAESEYKKQVDLFAAQVDRNKTETARLISSAQKEAHDRIAATENKYQSKVHQERKQFVSLLSREKKRSTAYKEKALDAHRREKLISETALAAAMYGENAALPTMLEVMGENWAGNIQFVPSPTSAPAIGSGSRGDVQSSSAAIGASDPTSAATGSGYGRQYQGSKQ